MNAATRGVVLAIAAVILGVIILGQGFGDDSPSLQSVGSSDGTSDDDGAADDGTSDDGAADDGTSDDDGAADDGTSDDGAADDTGADDGAASDDAGGDDIIDPDDTGDDGAPDILHPTAEVRVLVANGTTVAGAAGATREQLVTSQGYNGLAPTNTTSAVDESAIYYVPGYELDARQIAQLLNASPQSVQAMPADPPVEDLAEAHVLVVLGPDLVQSS